MVEGSSRRGCVWSGTPVVESQQGQAQQLAVAVTMDQAQRTMSRSLLLDGMDGQPRPPASNVR